MWTEHNIVPEKRGYTDPFSYFSTKTYVVDTQRAASKEYLVFKEKLNIFFCWNKKSTIWSYGADFETRAGV